MTRDLVLKVLGETNRSSLLQLNRTLPRNDGGVLILLSLVSPLSIIPHRANQFKLSLMPFVVGPWSITTADRASHFLLIQLEVSNSPCRILTILHWNCETRTIKKVSSHQTRAKAWRMAFREEICRPVDLHVKTDMKDVSTIRLMLTTAPLQFMVAPLIEIYGLDDHFLGPFRWDTIPTSGSVCSSPRVLIFWTSTTASAGTNC